ncbi:hypothetical protein VTL71DRAFT_1412 [Oculimacula yallundae]|uniref:2EXR domain-containing protein n=1 Tax=Oculimacula yallundae TaxID=86028 RepID=A0ABR4CAL4_9HELO
MSSEDNTLDSADSTDRVMSNGTYDEYHYPELRMVMADTTQREPDHAPTRSIMAGQGYNLAFIAGMRYATVAMRHGLNQPPASLPHAEFDMIVAFPGGPELDAAARPRTSWGNNVYATLTNVNLDHAYPLQDTHWNQTIPQMGTGERVGFTPSNDFGFGSGTGSTALATYNGPTTGTPYSSQDGEFHLRPASSSHDLEPYQESSEMELSSNDYATLSFDSGANPQFPQTDWNMDYSIASPADMGVSSGLPSDMSVSVQDLSDYYAQARFHMGDEAEEIAANPIGWSAFSRGPDTFDLFPKLPLELRTMIFVEAVNEKGFVNFHMKKTLSIYRDSQRKGPLIEEVTRVEYKRKWNYHYHSTTGEPPSPIMFVCKDALAAFKLTKPNTIKWMTKGNPIHFNADSDHIRMDKLSLYQIHHWNVNAREPGGWKKQFLGLDSVKSFYLTRSSLEFNLDDAVVDYVCAVDKVEEKRPNEEKALDTYDDEVLDARTFELLRMRRSSRFVDKFLGKFVIYLQDKGINVWMEDENGVAQLQVQRVNNGAAATPAA